MVFMFKPEPTLTLSFDPSTVTNLIFVKSSFSSLVFEQFTPFSTFVPGFGSGFGLLWFFFFFFFFFCSHVSSQSLSGRLFQGRSPYRCQHSLISGATPKTFPAPVPLAVNFRETVADLVFFFSTRLVQKNDFPCPDTLKQLIPYIDVLPFLFPSEYSSILPPLAHCNNQPCVPV